MDTAMPSGVGLWEKTTGVHCRTAVPKAAQRPTMAKGHFG